MTGFQIVVFSTLLGMVMALAAAALVAITPATERKMKSKSFIVYQSIYWSLYYGLSSIPLS